MMDKRNGKKVIQQEIKIASSLPSAVHPAVLEVVKAYSKSEVPEKDEDEERERREKAGEVASSLSSLLKSDSKERRNLPHDLRVALAKERLFVNINDVKIEQTDFAVLEAGMEVSDSEKLPLYSRYYYRTLAFEDDAIDMDKIKNVLKAIRQSASLHYKKGSYTSPDKDVLDFSFVFIGGYPEFIYESSRLSAGLSSVLKRKKSSL